MERQEVNIMNHREAKARGTEIAKMNADKAEQLWEKAWKKYLDIVAEQGYESPKRRPAPEFSRRPCEI